MHTISLFRIGRFFIYILAATVVMASFTSISAQDDFEARKKQLEEEKLLADLQKSIADTNKATAEAEKAKAEAEKALLGLKLPGIDATKLNTTAASSGSFIETRIQASKAMKALAKKIADPIRNKDLVIKNLIVYSPEDVKTIANYRQMLYQLRLIQTGYQQTMCDYLRVSKEACIAEIAKLARENVPDNGLRSNLAQIASSLISGWLPLFQTSVDIKNEAFTFEEAEFVSSIFAQLRFPNSEIDLYYPKRVPPSIVNCESIDLTVCSPMLDQLLNTDDAYVEASIVLAMIEKEIIDNPKDIVKLARLKPLKARLEQLNKVLIGIFSQLGIDTQNKAAERKAIEPEENDKEDTAAAKKPEDGKSKQKPAGSSTLRAEEKPAEKPAEGGKTLYSFLQAESINQLLNDQGYWLDVKVASASGSSREVKNVLTSIFYASRFSFSGGVTGYFFVFGPDGKTLLSGQEHYYQKYQKSCNVAKP